MAKDKEPELKPFRDQMKDTSDTIYVLAKLVSWMWLPILRCRMGTHAMGMVCPLASVAIFFWGGLAKEPLIIGYLVPWAIACACQRFTVDRQTHSRYAGDAWLTRFLFGAENEDAARMMESVMLLGLGFAAVAAAEPKIGLFMMIGGVALGVKEGIEVGVNKQMNRQMRDAQVARRWMSEQMRNPQS